MPKQQDPDEVVLKFTPANDGDYLIGVPARDLTARDMRRIEPLMLHAMTVPGASGQPLYTYTGGKLARSQERAAKETVKAAEAAPVAATAEPTAAAPDAGKE